MPQKHIEFLKSLRNEPYVPGDRIWRDEESAERLADKGFARIIDEEEQKARQEAAKNGDAGDQMTHHVEFKRGVDAYNPGDKAWFAEDEAKRLEGNGAVSVLSTTLDESTPKGASEARRKAKEAAQTREERLSGLPDGYQNLWSLASAVNERVDDELDGRATETLQEFCLDHWPEVVAVRGEE